MFSVVRRGGIEFYEAGELAALGFVTHAFCTRLGGVSGGDFTSLNTGFLVGDRPEDVRRNLERVGEAFAIPPGQLLLMGQVHGDRICVIDGQDAPEGLTPECDGLITARTGLALGIRTADCVPLLFVDRARRVIGTAHAGWRGTALGIAPKMVAVFAERFASRAEDLLIAIGPAIGSCCYEVDAPVYESFRARGDSGAALRPCRQGRWMLDLALANRLQLLEKGVPGDHILSSGLCTACRPDQFFSHRASHGSAGRLINFLMLTDGVHDLKNA
jgi:polyphenol oxidase